MLINWNHDSVRLFGRWDRRDPAKASTTTNGSSITIAIKGSSATLHFDTSTNSKPTPHLWISIDHGPQVEAPLARILHLGNMHNSEHELQIVMKSSSESQTRWFYPQEAVVRFVGVEAEDAAILKPINMPILEVVGDSITEGVLLETANTDVADGHERVFQDDSCATYAWKCAEIVGMRARPIGFGAVGTLKSGSGAVPNVIESYGFVYDGCPVEEEPADVVVIAHGANDQARTDQEFAPAYTELLQVIRAHNPEAKICAMSPFVGRFEEILPKIVREYNTSSGDSVVFISTSGWLPVEPVHPLRDGHLHAGRLLAQALKDAGVV